MSPSMVVSAGDAVSELLVTGSLLIRTTRLGSACAAGPARGLVAITVWGQDEGQNKPAIVAGGLARPWPVYFGRGLLRRGAGAARGWSCEPEGWSPKKAAATGRHRWSSVLVPGVRCDRPDAPRHALWLSTALGESRLPRRSSRATAGQHCTPKPVCWLAAAQERPPGCLARVEFGLRPSSRLLHPRDW